MTIATGLAVYKIAPLVLVVESVAGAVCETIPYGPARRRASVE
jgi:hypothetical protein